MENQLRLRDYGFAAYLVKVKGFKLVGLDQGNIDVKGYKYYNCVVELSEGYQGKLEDLHTEYKYTSYYDVNLLRRTLAKEAREK